MKLYCNIPHSTPNALARIVQDMTGQEAELVIADEEFRKTPGYKALTTTDKFPLLQTADGNLHESTAIAKYFCTLAGGKFLGNTAVERAHVDQWIAFGNTSIFPNWWIICQGIFGWGEVTQNEFNEASKNIKAHVKTVNTHLEGKKYLVGELTLADVHLANLFLYLFQTVLDGGFRKAMKNVSAWAESIYALDSFVKINGNVQLAAKALKPILKAEKKEEKKKEAPVQAAPKPKEEKPKENIELLPPTSFNLYDFKTFFVNHADKAGAAIDQWYKDLDWEGWAFWHLHYEKYEGEGEKIHVTNNLLGGFLNRAEHTNKYTFARMGVFGEEPNLEIKGVWLMRGKDEIPDGLRKQHPQFEYYRTRKLDPRNNPDDDKLVREYFGGQEEGIIEGLKAQTLKWFK
jgi:elongation factor 1-gamma